METAGLENFMVRILRTRVFIPMVNGDAIHEKDTLQQFRDGQWVDVPVVIEEIRMPFHDEKTRRFDNLQGGKPKGYGYE